jgi:hypothetical protein
MKKIKIYLLITFLVSTFFFIYLNFFFTYSGSAVFKNTSKCLLIYRTNFVILECIKFSDFYQFYMENNKNLFIKKIKMTILNNYHQYNLVFQISR